MSRLWRWLLGVDTSAEFGDGKLSLEFAAFPQGGWAVLAGLLAVAAVVGVWLLYLREGRSLSRAVRLALASLRLGILALVAFMLCELVLVVTRSELVPSHLPLLLDVSQSMSLVDPYPDEAQARQTAEAISLVDEAGRANVARLRATQRLDLARAGLARILPELSEGRRIIPYRFDGRAEPLTRDQDLSSLSPVGVSTGIGNALTSAVAAHRGQPLAGMVLVTDGRSNSGEDPRKAVKQLADLGIPLLVLAAGTAEGPRNVRLADLEVSPVVFVRDPIEISVVTESRGLRDVTGSVVLEQRQDDGTWKEIGREELLLGEDSTLQRTTFRVTPETIGQTEFRARVGEVGPELTEDDNLAAKTVRVVRQGIRVLMIAGYPSPEMQFLRNALLRDTALEFASWLQDASEGYEHVGHRPVRRLPANQKELDHYDVLLLFDPDMKALGPSWPELIARFVGEAGGGLIYVAGETYSQSLFNPESSLPTSSDNSWLKVLPVVRDPSLYQSAADVRLSSRETWVLELTPEGNDDSVFRFDPDAGRNREIMTSLPGMYWHFPVTRARPGAIVLARHGDPRMRNQFGRHVLLASQLYGPGRAVFIGFDSTYRWRYLHEAYFDGFWARLVDRVGRSKVLGGRYPFTLSTDKTEYRSGDRVTIRAEIADSPDASAGLGELRAELELAGRQAEPLPLEPLPEDPNVHEAAFQAREPGVYTLRVVAGAAADADAQLRPATLTFKVEPPRAEFDQPTWDRGLMDELAQATGGKVFTLADIDKLPDVLTVRQVERSWDERYELWGAPLVCGLIVLLLTIEWVLRKICRMA